MQSDKHCKDLKYAIGQKVPLSIRNLRFKLPRKLQVRYMGPFEVLKRMGLTAYKLDLSHSFALKMIHPLFNVSLLRDFDDIGLDSSHL